MLKNYFKVAARSILRQKGYALINIVGLALGMAACILITLWVLSETSYDRYHANADRLFRVTMKIDAPNYHTHFARCAYGYVNRLPDDLPEVEDLTRFQWVQSVVLANGDNRYHEDRFFKTDPNVFKMFSFHLIKGDPATALAAPNRIVISELMARKYFGNEDPTGKELTAIDQSSSPETRYLVAGVMSDVPVNSHFHPDFLASFETPRDATTGGWSYRYVLLREGADWRAVQDKIPGFIATYVDSASRAGLDYILQPLTAIHLNSHIDRELEPNGNITYIYMFSIVALLILVIACINYMNLATAKFSRRAPEIGVRKVVGASRWQLGRQFMAEAVLLSIISLIASFILVEAALPIMEHVAGRQYSMSTILNWHCVFGFFVLGVGAGILAGSYPALYLSAVEPVRVLKGKSGGRTRGLAKGFSVRNVLVVLQFSISIALIICCAVTWSQHTYLMDQSLGKQGDQVVALPNIPISAKSTFETFRDLLRREPGILDVTATMEEPGKEILDACRFRAQGTASAQNGSVITVNPVAANYLAFSRAEIIAGRDFSPTAGKDSTYEYIVNESAVGFIGWNSPAEALGKQFLMAAYNGEQMRGEVIGVVKDFAISSLRKKIGPLVYFQKPIWYSCFQVKIDPSKASQALAAIKGAWSKLNPAYPCDYRFADELFEKLYQAEQRQISILGLFSIVGVVIACLGLFGLATSAVEQRRKEIGVRKVLGASVAEVVRMLSWNTVILIGIANLVAWPIAYYLMRRWLNEYAYRIEINWLTFALTGILALAIALLTVSFNAIRAASANPVESLKYE